MTINFTQSLAHGLEVLLLFDTSTPVLTVADVSKRLGYSLSKSYRLTRTLIRYGLVEPADGTAKYCLGLNILRLGLLAKKRFTLPVIAQPLMKELSVRTKEAVLLTAVSMTKGICLERMESQESVRPSIFQPGELFHLHAGASSKILMAYLPEKEWDKIIEKEGLRRFTAKTITRAEALKKHLREIRKNGYAFSDGEVFGDVRAVGAPILDKKGNLVAGLSIVGPTYRFTKTKVKALSKLVVDYAAKISDDYAKKLEP
jgi:IclR family transcriptional regulator, KDG regulon repressor